MPLLRRRHYAACLLVFTLAYAGCDSAVTDPGGPTAQEVEPRWTAQDYVQAYSRLDTLKREEAIKKEGSVSLSVSGEALSATERSLVRFARERGASANQSLAYVTKTREINESHSAETIYEQSAAALPEKRGAFADKMFGAAIRASSLGQIKKSLSVVEAEARRTLSGEDLQFVLQVKEYMLGTAMYWAGQGRAFQGAKTREEALCTPDVRSAYGQDDKSKCNVAPREANYYSYRKVVAQGMRDFILGCTGGGTAGFWAAGAPGAFLGCALVGVPTVVAGTWAERERQRLLYQRAVREWCDECRYSGWKASRFCAEELNSI